MENENAFKNLINSSVVALTAKTFKEVYPAFNDKRFIKVSQELKPLELKARVLALTAGLKVELPEDYKEAAKILGKVLKKKELTGFQLWPVSEYISQFGTNHYDISLHLMCLLTEQFTSEFAVRPFLIKDHAKVLAFFQRRVNDKSVHIRRWVSEGTRPILPWGGKIPAFIKNPELTLPLLEELKNDDELYVRKSVANHLNDISKNHPELVVKILTRWEKETSKEHAKKIEWIKKHALRVLIKKGHPGALKLMGAGSEASVKILGFKINARKYSLGDHLEFELALSSTGKKKQKIIVDYLIHFKKANGTNAPKVFKFKTMELEPGEKVVLNKKHALKKITTMTFYKGQHEISIQINGKIYDKLSWMFHP